MRSANTPWTWLLMSVFVHLVAVAIHGGSHAAAHVATTTLQNVFILTVIVVGPVAGLWLASHHRSLGGWLVAATMSGALAFGVVNHFLIPGGDRIDQVAGAWSVPFAASAVALAMSEIGGACAGFWYATHGLEQSS